MSATDKVRSFAEARVDSDSEVVRDGLTYGDCRELYEEYKAACSLLAVLHGDGGHHIDEVGFVQACKDAQEVRHALVNENGRLRTLLTQPDGLSFRHLRKANTKRCESSYHPVDAWSLTDWLTAAAGELGELAGVIKNIRRAETEGQSAHTIGVTEKRELGYEAADVVIYLCLLCARAGVDLGEAVREKFNIVSDRTGSKVKL